MATKRGYSRAFTAKRETQKHYLLAKIPARLWVSARAQARREGKSMRALLLELLTTYTTDPTVNPTEGAKRS